MPGGPTPKPTAILKLHGSAQAKLRKKEPQPTKTKPKCPVWIREQAKDHWREIAKELDHMGVLTRIDRDTLMGYCQLWAKWKACELHLMEYGFSFETTDTNGNLIWRERPESALATRLVDQLLKLQIQFGMTPSARTRIQVDGKKQEPKDEGKERFFKRKTS